MLVVSTPRPLLAGASLVLVLAVDAGPTAAPAAAQAQGAPVNYGQPYSPPWQAGARDNRRPLDGTPRRASQQPAWEPPPPLPAIWQGLYLGAHGGWAFGRVADRIGDTIDLSGGILGLHLGYNHQMGNWVLGLEGDVSWSGAEGGRTYAGPVVVDAFSDWHSSLRLRAGYAVGNTLFFLTGGVAFANLDLGASNGLVEIRSSDTFVGYAVGGGLEMKLAPNLTGRIEAIHYGFGERSLAFPTGKLPVDLDFTTVRAGISWQFR